MTKVYDDQDAQREIADLEDLYNRGSIADQERNTAGSNGVGDKVKALEDTFDQPSIEDHQRNTNPTNAPTDMFTGSGTAQGVGKLQSFKALLKRRPTEIGIGAVSSVVAIALTIFVFSSIGHLQFFHVGEWLDGAFSSNESSTSERAYKLMVYARTKDVTRTRLGILGNALASDFDKKMKASGFKIETTKFGRATAIVWDPTIAKDGYKPSRQELEDMKGALEREAGAKGAVIKNGTVELPLAEQKFKYRSKMLKFLVANELYHGKAISRLQTWTGYKRYGLGKLNAVTSIDTKFNEKIDKAYQNWKENKKAKSKTNVTDVSADPKNKPQENQTPDQRAQAEADAAGTTETNKTVADAAEGKLSTKITALQGGAGAVGMIGLICVAQNLANGQEISRIQARREALTAEFNDGIPLKDKIAAGANDINPIALGFYSMELNAKNQSFANSNAYKLENGATEGGVKLPDKYVPNPEGSEIANILNSIPLINTGCGVMSNSVVSWSLNIAGSLTPLGFAQTAVSYFAFPKAIEAIESLLSTDPIVLEDLSGAEKAEALKASTEIVANQAISAMGASGMTEGEVTAYRDLDKEFKKTEDQNRSIADRYLNPYKNDTITGKAIDNINTANFATSIISIRSFIISPLDSFINHRTKASITPTYGAINYGMIKMGFPMSVLTDIENPLDNASEVAGFLDQGLMDRLKTCTGIDTITSPELDFKYDENSAIPSYEYLIKQHPECKSGALAMEGQTMATTTLNSLSPEDAKYTKLRVAVFDTFIAKTQTCLYKNDEELCSEMFGTSEESNNTSAETGQAGQPINTRFGPFVFPVKASQEEIKKGGWCWNNSNVTCHDGDNDANTGYYAADIMIKEGVPILSATDGKVVKVEQTANNKAGTAKEAIITIKANDCDDTGQKLDCIGKGTLFWYAHMKPNSATVKEGDKVKAGQQIAISGGAPQGDGTAHLHIDASDRKNDYRQDCSRENVSACQSAGFINIQPQLYESFMNIGNTTTTTVSGWQWPLKEVSLNGCFYEDYGGYNHAGIDFSASTGTDAYAVADGVVHGFNSDWGMITIKHNTSDGVVYSVYEHMLNNKFKVKKGDTVTAGDKIGETDNTAPPGGSNGSHLHLTITKDPNKWSRSDFGTNSLINPLKYLNNNKDYKNCSAKPESK